MMDRTHIVYRCFNRVGELLYIGQTSNSSTRFATHWTQSKWWPEVAGFNWTRPTSERAALRYERLAIRREHPRYNVQHGDATPQVFDHSLIASPEPVIGVTEAAQILGVSRPTVKRMAKAGTLAVAIKMWGQTGAYLFHRADVEALAAERVA